MRENKLEQSIEDTVRFYCKEWNLTPDVLIAYSLILAINHLKTAMKQDILLEDSMNQVTLGDNGILRLESLGE